MDICQSLVDLIKAELDPKEFSTGSRGFYANGKITVDGVRYQAQAQSVLVGSKDDPSLTVEATTEEMAAALGELVTNGLGPRTFNSGRTGYRAGARVHAQGQRYQASVQAVRLS